MNTPVDREKELPYDNSQNSERPGDVGADASLQEEYFNLGNATHEMIAELGQLTVGSEVLEVVCKQVGIKFNQEYPKLFDGDSSFAHQDLVRRAVQQAQKSLSSNDPYSELVELAKVRIVFETVALQCAISHADSTEKLLQSLGPIQSDLAGLQNERFTDLLADEAWRLDSLFHQEIFLALNCSHLAQLVEDIAMACRDFGKPKCRTDIQTAIAEHDRIIVALKSCDHVAVFQATIDHIGESASRWCRKGDSMDAVKKFEETNRSYFQALEQFECDLPDLMKRFENMWVLYSTEGRLCVSKNVGKIDRMLSNRKLLAVECCIRFISKETIEDVEVCFGASST